MDIHQTAIAKGQRPIPCPPAPHFLPKVAIFPSGRDPSGVNLAQDLPPGAEGSKTKREGLQLARQRFQTLTGEDRLAGSENEEDAAKAAAEKGGAAPNPPSRVNLSFHVDGIVGRLFMRGVSSRMMRGLRVTRAITPPHVGLMAVMRS